MNDVLKQLMQLGFGLTKVGLSCMQTCCCLIQMVLIDANGLMWLEKQLGSLVSCN